MLAGKIGYFRASLDPAAAAYIAAVEAADGQALEAAVRTAINNFVVGCKTDGIWSAIKASCVLMGARTLAGALVPLVGAAPTNVNFVAGDYNRKTGLVGNGSNKFLDANRNNNADPQNSNHLSVYSSALPSAAVTPNLIGAGITGNTGSSAIAIPGGGNLTMRSRSSSGVSVGAPTVGFIGKSRVNSAAFLSRNNGQTASNTLASQAAFNGNVHVFKTNGSTIHSDGRIAFYSIGEGLTLASLDSRVTALYNAIGAAIP
jgi:hypothetical protein